MRMLIVAVLSCTVLAAVAGGAAPNPAQQLIPGAPIEPGRSIEVASVRLSHRRTPPSTRITDTRVDLINVSLLTLLVRVFRIDQLAKLSAPDWLRTVNIDVQATIPEGSTREHVPEMLKTLLMARFGLRARVEARPTDVYELVVGSGGVQMQEVPAVDDIEKVFPTDSPQKPPVFDGTNDGIEGRLRNIVTRRGLIIITEQMMYERIRTDRGTQEIDAARITMAELSTLLSFTVDRPVVDRTMLLGLYRLRIELPPPNFRIARPFITNTPTNEPDVVSPFKAVEQLGLRLEARRGMLDTLVVDHIDRVPTEN